MIAYAIKRDDGMWENPVRPGELFTTERGAVLYPYRDALMNQLGFYAREADGRVRDAEIEDYLMNGDIGDDEALLDLAGRCVAYQGIDLALAVYRAAIEAYDRHA